MRKVSVYIIVSRLGNYYQRSSKNGAQVAPVNGVAAVLTYDTTTQFSLNALS